MPPFPQQSQPQPQPAKPQLHPMQIIAARRLRELLAGVNNIQSGLGYDQAVAAALNQLKNEMGMGNFSAYGAMAPGTEASYWDPHAIFQAATGSGLGSVLHPEQVAPGQLFGQETGMDRLQGMADPTMEYLRMQGYDPDLNQFPRPMNPMTQAAIQSRLAMDRSVKPPVMDPYASVPQQYADPFRRSQTGGY